MKKTLRCGLQLMAAAGLLLLPAASARASSHMDAPLITLDDAANTTDVYAFVSQRFGRKYLTTALAVYPHEEPGIGPNKYNFDDDVLYEIRVATGNDVAKGRTTYSYQFKFNTTYRNRNTILQSYLGVINDVGDASQNLIQRYTVDKVDWRNGGRTRLGTGIVPPNNQGNATPKYNRNNDGEQPAQDGVATEAELDAYTSQSIAELEDGYVAFAGQRDDGFYADVQAVFDLLKLRAAGQAVDSQGGFNVHTIALNIPIEEIGGDQQIVGVYATTSRRRFRILGRRQRRRVRRIRPGRAPGQSAVQRRSGGDQGQGSLQPHHTRGGRPPVPQVRSDAGTGSAHQRARVRIERRADDEPYRHRGNLHPRPHQGGPLDRAGAAGRRRRQSSDQSR